jgi:hypothetical protein
MSLTLGPVPAFANSGSPVFIDLGREIEASYEHLRTQSLSFLKYLTPRLGSTNSQLIAIFEITLFTSVEKGFHFSNYYYYQDLHHGFFESASQPTC